MSLSPGLGRAAHALHDRRRPAWVGRGSGRRRRRTARGSVSAQLSRNAARSPSTAGPRIRKCVSRHSCSFAGVAEPLVGDADAAGERRSPRRRSSPCGACGGSPGRAGAAAAGGTSGRARRLAPSASMQRRVRSGARPRRRGARAPARRPARARRARCANSRPISPSQYTNVRKSIVCSASSIASSIAGKISSPLRSTSMRLPSVAGTPMTPSRVRRSASTRSRHRRPALTAS